MSKKTKGDIPQMENNFYESLNKSEKPELQVQALLEINNYEVIDVRFDKEYQQKDIDFLATKDDKTISIEVKGCSRTGATGNIYIEDMSDLEKNLKGWLHYCEADYIVLVDTLNDYCYFLPFRLLKQIIAGKHKDIRCKHVELGSNRQDKSRTMKTTTGYLISVTDIRKNFNIISRATLPLY